MKKVLYLLVLSVLGFACSTSAPEEQVAPHSMALTSPVVQDSVYYFNHPQGIAVHYTRIADTTFTDPITQEAVPGISYTVLIYDSLQIKSPWQGEIQKVSFRRPSGKPALNLSSRGNGDNIMFVRKDQPNNAYSYFFYYKRVPVGSYAPMVCRFAVGKYAADTNPEYSSIANWRYTTLTMERKNGNISTFHIANPFAE
jgi:hypothetical protein